MRRTVYVMLAVLAVLAAACGDDPDLGGEGGDRPTEQIVAVDNVFGEGGADVRVAAGTEVTWSNEGQNVHDIVSVGADPAWGVNSTDFGPGEEYARIFTDPGVYAYYCSIHGSEDGGMRGRVLVGDVDVPPTSVTPRPGDGPEGASGRTVRVPADHPTIQAAVDAAGPGDLVLVSPGVYREGVEVPASKANLTIRGLDRDRTILDGEFERANGVKVVDAPGVVVENLTARNFTTNGFFWTGVEGYRGSYLTAIRNGDYGLYAFESTGGQFDHSYASGSPDAGFYIGGCQPCDALVTDVLAEWNGFGFQGTNAGGGLVIANSVFRHNRSGILPNSGSYEPSAPQAGITIVGNLVHDNDNGQTPAIAFAISYIGNGIVVAGGLDNVVVRNRVVDHAVGGIVVVTYAESERLEWVPTGNEVRDNVVSGSGVADLVLWLDGAGTRSGGNCFSGNTHRTSAPASIESAVPCQGTGTGDLTTGAFDIGRLTSFEGKPSSTNYREAVIPEVPDQPELPDAASAPARPAVDLPPSIDVDAISVPAPPG